VHIRRICKQACFECQAKNLICNLYFLEACIKRYIQNLNFCPFKVVMNLHFFSRVLSVCVVKIHGNDFCVPGIRELHRKYFCLQEEYAERISVLFI